MPAAPSATPPSLQAHRSVAGVVERSEQHGLPGLDGEPLHDPDADGPELVGRTGPPTQLERGRAQPEPPGEVIASDVTVTPERIEDAVDGRDRQVAGPRRLGRGPLGRVDREQAQDGEGAVEQLRPRVAVLCV
jgi:hypothetical protein